MFSFEGKLLIISDDMEFCSLTSLGYLMLNKMIVSMDSDIIISAAGSFFLLLSLKSELLKH